LLSPSERARVAAPELPVAQGSESRVGRGRPVLPEGELHAAIAMLAEGRDPALRRAHLVAFLASAGGKGPWAEHARRALEGGKAGK